MALETPGTTPSGLSTATTAGDLSCFSIPGSASSSSWASEDFSSAGGALPAAAPAGPDEWPTQARYPTLAHIEGWRDAPVLVRPCPSSMPRGCEDADAFGRLPINTGRWVRVLEASANVHARGGEQLLVTTRAEISLL